METTTLTTIRRETLTTLPMGRQLHHNMMLGLKTSLGQVLYVLMTGWNLPLMRPKRVDKPMTYYIEDNSMVYVVYMCSMQMWMSLNKENL